MKHLASLALAAALFIPAQQALGAGEGEWWSLTTRIDMPGMPPGMNVEGQTIKFCRIKGEENRPVKSDDDKSCSISDVKQAGNTTTFKMKCTGKDAMTGTGELTHTPTTFNQKIRVRSGSDDMTLLSSGKRIGGACKAGV